MAKITVGIKIGSTSLKFVELSHGKDRQKVLNAGIEHLSYSEEEGRYPRYTALLAQKLKDLVRVHKLNRRRIVTGVQGEHVVVRIVRIPYMKDSELREAIRWEAEEHLPYPVEDMAISYHVLQRDLMGSSGREMSLALVGARVEAVDDLMQIFQQADLSPAIIDVNSLALYNVFENAGIPGAGGTALLNIGHLTSNLLILAANHPFLVRDIAFGGDNITRGLASALSVTYVEAETIKRASQRKNAVNRLGLEASEDTVNAAIGNALDDFIKEVVRSFEYFTSNKEGSPVTRIILSGGGSMVAGMGELLAQELEVTVEPLDPFANTAYSSDRVAGIIPELSPLLAIPMGCALREISSL